MSNGQVANGFLGSWKPTHLLDEKASNTQRSLIFCHGSHQHLTSGTLLSKKLADLPLSRGERPFSRVQVDQQPMMKACAGLARGVHKKQE